MNACWQWFHWFDCFGGCKIQLHKIKFVLDERKRFSIFIPTLILIAMHIAAHLNNFKYHFSLLLLSLAAAWRKSILNWKLHFLALLSLNKSISSIFHASILVGIERSAYKKGWKRYTIFQAVQNFLYIMNIATVLPKETC